MADQQTVTTLTAKDLDIGTLSNKFLALYDDFITVLPAIIIGITVFMIFCIVAAIVRAVIKRALRGHRHYNVALVISRLVRWLVILIGFLVSVAIIFPSVSFGDILAGLGLGGIAAGFAFKDVLQNYLSGILILLSQPFKIGDEVKHKDIEGTVEFVDTRSTFIRLFDGTKAIIPNGEVYTNPIIVNTACKARRSDYDIGIGCNDNFEKAISIILSVLKSTEGVMAEPKPDVLVTALNDYSNNLKARWWTDPHQGKTNKIKSEILKQVKDKLIGSGIDLPFPTNVVLYHDQTEETDGDRARQREGWPAGDQPPKPNTMASAVKGKQ